MQKTRLDFVNDYTSDAFPSATIFDPDVIKTEAGWKTILKEEENFDKFDGKGNFNCGAKFLMGFLYDGDDYSDILPTIPHSGKYEIIKVK